MNDYSFFLFGKLFEEVYGPSELPYDRLHGVIRLAYEQYITSPYNSAYEPEYECMVAFLKKA
jgi:hypothetical protein